MLLKILKWLLMAAYLKFVIDFFTAQWNAISQSWSFYITGILFIGIIEWIILNWIKKEQDESTKAENSLLRENVSQYEKEIKNLKNKIVLEKEKISFLEEENESLKKGIFLTEEAKNKAASNFYIERIASFSNKEMKVKINHLLEMMKKYLTEGITGEEELDLNLEIIMLKFNNIMITLDEAINKALIRQKNKITFEGLKKYSKKDNPTKDDKLMLIYYLQNKLNNISE